jgi:hypothetical protein
MGDDIFTLSWRWLSPSPKLATATKKREKKGPR